MRNNNFENEIKNLNKAQNEAVNSIYWPIMVVAWPGTWKTQIIWLRTANIILKTWVNPSNILITTFTDAWVIAIRKRLLKFLWNEAYKVNVSTIHSLSQDIIKTFPEKFIEYKAWTAIDEVEALEIIKNIIDNLVDKKKIETLITDYDRYFYLRDIKSSLSILKQEWINKEKLSILIEKQREKYQEELLDIKPTLKKYETIKTKNENHIKKLLELKLFFEEYNKYLRTNSKYDFNDMINFVLEQLKVDDEMRLYYAEKFQFIMLDEYQDTNNAQNQIIDLILSESDEEPNIMVVWDDDQSIYRFQWANIENMLDFSTKYKNTKFIVLEENYRSNQQILDLSSILIDNNNERLSKKINTINKKLTSSWELKLSKTKPKLYKAINDLDERVFIISKIKEIMKDLKSINISEIAIIVRWNREVDEWTKLLQQNAIEVESKIKTDILKSNYINFILKYLKIINNPYEDEKSLIEIMRTSLVWLNSKDVLKINRELYIKNYKLKNKITIIDYLMKDEYLKEIELIEKENLVSFREKVLDFWEKLAEYSFIEFFNYFIEKTGILKYIEINWNFDDLEDIYTLFNKIKDWSINDKNFTINKLLSKIELFKLYNYPIPRQILKQAKIWVQVLTAHSSKWLEYDTVFVPWLYNWNWENKRVINRLKLPDNLVWEWLQQVNFDQIEEDRRLFFVALTRAKENLYLSYPAWIWLKPLLQSSFIEEISWYYEEIENIDVGNEYFHSDEILKNGNENIRSLLVEIIENDLKNSLIKHSEIEFDYIKDFLETYKLSPSDLNTFLENPMDFLNNVIFKYPFLDNKYTIFWKVYHRTLELFYLKYKKEWQLPDKKYLTYVFSWLLDNEILTPSDYENLKEKWLKWLEGYYDLYSPKNNEPLMLEYNFRQRNIVFDWIPLTWAIDKIEKLNWLSTSNNSNINLWQQMAFFKETVALVDYKTWKPKTIWEIKWIDRYWNKKTWEWKYFRQVMFYKLLCELDFEFKSKFEIWALALDFVEGRDWVYKYIEIDYTPEEFEEFKNELKEARKKIINIDFWKNLLKSD